MPGKVTSMIQKSILFFLEFWLQSRVNSILPSPFMSKKHIALMPTTTKSTHAHIHTHPCIPLPTARLVFIHTFG